ncbi:MAG: hypothetical protein WB347_06715 [Terriglobales bacterium]
MRIVLSFVLGHDLPNGSSGGGQLPPVGAGEGGGHRVLRPACFSAQSFYNVPPGVKRTPVRKDCFVPEIASPWPPTRGETICLTPLLDFSLAPSVRSLFQVRSTAAEGSLATVQRVSPD